MFLGSAAFLSTWLGGAPALACSCIPMDIPSSWFLNSDAYIVEVLREVPQGANRVYAARVKTAFKGCAPAGEVIAMVTPKDDISCGVSLTIGESYLMFGDRRPPLQNRYAIGVNLCNDNRLASQIAPREHEYLLARPVFCEDTRQFTCANGSQPVQCFVDPCQYAQACGTDLTCIPNTCHGGCDWEQYDRSGQLMCFGP